MKKISLAVIYGGVSGEHEVSLLSARSVMAALDPAKYRITPIRISKKGKWSVDQSELSRFDLVFPLVHGTGGEDGSLQGLFELADVAYVGSGVLGSAIGMDKILQKKVLAQEGFPLAAYVHFTADEWSSGSEDIVARVEKVLAYPCFVKPSNMGSSVGISKAHHRKELMRGINEALRYDRRVVVEAAVPEAREIECAVLGNGRPHASVLGEIVPSNEFYDYAAKYLDGKSRTVVPAELPHATAEKIRMLALKAFATLDAAGLARVDFFVRKGTGEIYINEINTLPGFTAISMYPKLWEATGIGYSGLLDEIVRYALERAREKRSLSRSYVPPKRVAKAKTGRTKARRTSTKRR